MKMLLVCLSILITSHSLSFSKFNNQIPFGIEPTMDGVSSTGEWDDALEVMLQVQVDHEISVKVKHDNENLYIKFEGMMHTSPNFIGCPEVMIRSNNSDSEVWESSDWWFHISATECWSCGEYGNYESCVPSNPDWGGTGIEPNNEQDCVEIWISFEKIQIDPLTVGQIKLCFDITNTQDFWAFWPSLASKESPASWQTMIFESVNSVEHNLVTHSDLKIFPNPVSTTSGLNLSFNSNSDGMAKINITNITGVNVIELNKSITMGNNKISIPELKLTPGIYFATITKNGRFVGRSKLIVL